ncbi:hypothetical protein [Sphingobium yanoikuyae]|uniref:hypothetical protein n=1 Tax=Sphingobium yanoikuyae TaxID=13690 RepID=UPI000846BC08|nr:hypothetical protein [Sphingobium yanoikuyae]
MNTVKHDNGAMADPLGELLVEKGFAPNLALLDINHALDVPCGFELPAPWNLPSRLFQFPIEVCRPDGDQPRRIGLRHPLLADHPYVRHVEQILGLEIDRHGAPNRHGYSSASTARWWHAVDLICAGKWRELLETQLFTDPASILRAVCIGCRYSPHDVREGRGHISTAEAREIIREMGATESDDRKSILLSFMAPSLCKPDNGPGYWPINPPFGLCAEDQAWAFIHGIEDGWFAHDRSGHLQWTQIGRDRHAAGEASSFTEASGQTAFAF